MMLIWVGAILSLAGVVWMASRSLRRVNPGPAWKPLHGGHGARGTGAWLKANWPGLGLVVLGIVLVLVSKML
jgi:hypothetical protein